MSAKPPVVLSILAIACSGFAPPEPDRPAEEKVWQQKQSAEAVTAYQQRGSRIEAEIERLTDHLWAGSYYHGDGLGVNAILTLAPESGCVFLWTGCMGVYDRNYGDVTVTGDGTLKLSLEFANSQRGFQGVATELIPVQWGERHYLIPTDEIQDFCNDVSRGGEPRTRIHGMYYLKQDDVAKSAGGLPNLPKKYRHHLLTNPIHATITSVGASDDKPLGGSEIKRRATTVTIDAGQADGVRVGMIFDPPGESFKGSLKITRVDKHASEGRFWSTFFDEGNPPDPKIGWKIVAGIALEPSRVEEPFVDLGLDAALAKARKEGRVVMIDFTAPWCRACKLLDQTAWKDDKVRAWIKERTVLLTIDAGRYRSLSEKKYKVESYPTILFANPDGKEIGRLVGYRDAKTFLSESEALLSKNQDGRNSSGR